MTAEAMLATLSCPKCRRSVTAPDYLARQAMNCPTCRVAMRSGRLPPPELEESAEDIAALPESKPPVPRPLWQKRLLVAGLLLAMMWVGALAGVVVRNLLPQSAPPPPVRWGIVHVSEAGVEARLFAEGGNNELTEIEPIAEAQALPPGDGVEFAVGVISLVENSLEMHQAAGHKLPGVRVVLDPGVADGTLDALRARVGEVRVLTGGEEFNAVVRELIHASGRPAAELPVGRGSAP